MTKLISYETNMDFTGSNGGRDIPYAILDGEPDAAMLEELNGMGFQFANGDCIPSVSEADMQKGTYKGNSEITVIGRGLVTLVVVIMPIIATVAWCVYVYLRVAKLLGGG